MTSESDGIGPPKERYKGSFETSNGSHLGPLKPIIEKANENEPEMIEIKTKVRIECNSTRSVPSLVTSFLSQLLRLDPTIILYGNDNTFYGKVDDIPKKAEDLKNAFPGTIINRRSGSRLVLQLSFCSTMPLTDLKKRGLNSWCAHEKLSLEQDAYLTADVRDASWLLGRDPENVSKPHLSDWIYKTINNNKLLPEEHVLLNKIKANHPFSGQVPPFSLYFRNTVTANNVSTSAIVLRTDRVSVSYFNAILSRLLDDGVITNDKGQFIPFGLQGSQIDAFVDAIHMQNVYLDTHSSIPIVGLSFASLTASVSLPGKLPDKESKVNMERLLLNTFVQIEPTAKSDALGRFNLIVETKDIENSLAFIKTEFEQLWQHLPIELRNHFADKEIFFPRLTLGSTNQSTVMSRISDNLSHLKAAVMQGDESQWKKPPRIVKRPPLTISINYDYPEHHADHNADLPMGMPNNPTQTKMDNKPTKKNKSKNSNHTNPTIDTQSIASSQSPSKTSEFTDALSTFQDSITSLIEKQTKDTHALIAKQALETTIRIETLAADFAALKADHAETRSSSIPSTSKQQVMQSTPDTSTTIPTSMDYQETIKLLIRSTLQEMLPLITEAVSCSLISLQDDEASSHPTAPPTELKKRSTPSPPLTPSTKRHDTKSTPKHPTQDKSPITSPARHPQDHDSLPSTPTSRLDPIRRQLHPTTMQEEILHCFSRSREHQ